MKNLRVDILYRAWYNNRNRGIIMSLSFSYVKELEFLIIDKLLPVYEKYYRQKGINNPLADINPDLLTQVRKVKKLPALLKAKET